MFQFINASLHTLRHINCQVNLCYEQNSSKELFLITIIIMYFTTIFFLEIFTKCKYSFLFNLLHS